MVYSKKTLEHFMNPRNMGKLDNPDGIGRYGDPECGDYIEVYIKVEHEHITEIKFLCKGCPSAIALGSIMTELAKGKHVDEAAEITDEMILDALGEELPEGKAHCSNLGSEALYNAIMSYVVKSINAG